jgi:hypothetical protein
LKNELKTQTFGQKISQEEDKKLLQLLDKLGLHP